MQVSNGTGCNLFNWCSNPWGCCPTAAGCNSTSQLLAFGSCILRKQANLTMPSLSTVASDVQPAAVYTATQAQQWDTAQGHAAALLSSAHAFDSGERHQGVLALSCKPQALSHMVECRHLRQPDSAER